MLVKKKIKLACLLLTMVGQYRNSKASGNQTLSLYALKFGECWRKQAGDVDLIVYAS